MNIRELMELLSEADPDMEVLIPADCLNGFTGQWFSPCACDTGVSELGIDGSDETRESFIIVPHAFFEEMAGPPPELN